jgi:hypothetical protein
LSPRICFLSRRTPDIAWQVVKEGHEVKLFIEAADEQARVTGRTVRSSHREPLHVDIGPW